MIFNDGICANRKGLIFFKHQKHGAFPLDTAYLEHLSVIVIIQFATNEQLKDSTHMFFFQIPCYKL
jgi:hypothetical protein